MRAQNPLVYIVVLNWNGWRDTVACLHSLEALDYSNWRVIVVDNASTDESVARIRENFATIEVIRADQNRGFSAGNNVGIRRALAHSAEYVWLLNNDAKADSHALSALVRLAESNARIGAVGSVIYEWDQPKEIQTWGGGRVIFWRARTYVCTREVPAQTLDYLAGASLLLKKTALEDVGFLDEQFFMYWEDTDIGLRLKGEGWMLAVAPDSHVWHKRSASLQRSPAIDYFMISSMRLFVRRHAPYPKISMLVGSVEWLGKRLMRREWKRAQATYCALMGRPFEVQTG